MKEEDLTPLQKAVSIYSVCTNCKEVLFGVRKTICSMCGGDFNLISKIHYRTLNLMKDSLDLMKRGSDFLKSNPNAGRNEIVDLLIKHKKTVNTHKG